MPDAVCVAVAKVQCNAELACRSQLSLAENIPIMQCSRLLQTNGCIPHTGLTSNSLLEVDSSGVETAGVASDGGDCARKRAMRRIAW